MELIVHLQGSTYLFHGWEVVGLFLLANLAG